MDATGTYAALAFSSLFAVLNPLATIPPFVAMTADNTVAERKAMARRACAIACCILLVFGLTGMQVLSFFGISLAAFQIAGGLILVRVGMELMRGSRALKITTEERAEGVDKDDISVTPLAVPILCGPATIATGILVRGEGGWQHGVVLASVVVAIYLSIYVMLVLASAHSDNLGPTPIKISSRLMGLVLVAIAVEFMVRGIGESGLLRS